MKNKAFNNLVKNYYEKKKIKKFNNKDNFFYLYAIKNKLLYFYCKNFVKTNSDLIKKILFEGSTMIRKKNKSKDLINKISKKYNLEFKDLKTERIFDDVNTDFDVLVRKKDFQIWKKKLVKFGFDVKKHHTFFKSTSDYQKNFLKKNYANIDLTIHFNYKGFDYLSEKYLWSKIVSDEEKKIMIMSLGIIFKRVYINLNDFFLIYNFLKKSKFSKESIREMKKYGWYEIMKCFIDEIKSTFENIEDVKFPYFSKKLFFKVLKFDFKSLLNFPYWFWFYFFLSQLRSFIFYRGHYLPFNVFWIPYRMLR